VGGAFEGAAMTVYDGATIAPGLSGFVRRASAPAQPAVQEVAIEPIAAAPEEAPPPAPPAATEISAPAPAEQ
jgi:hypothetical protein